MQIFGVFFMGGGLLSLLIVMSSLSHTAFVGGSLFVIGTSVFFGIY